MLEILSETKDPTRVQPHLKKCFEGINRLQFDDQLDILAMYSSEMEKVDFSQVISTSVMHSAVEKWLLQVQEVMVMSIHDVIDNSHKVSQQSRYCIEILNFSLLVLDPFLTETNLT